MMGEEAKRFRESRPTIEVGQLWRDWINGGQITVDCVVVAVGELDVVLGVLSHEGSARELVVLVLELSGDPGFVKGVTLHDTDEHDTGKVSTWNTGNFLKPFKLA